MKKAWMEVGDYISTYSINAMVEINSNLELDFIIEIIKVEIWLSVGIRANLDLVNSPFM